MVREPPSLEAVEPKHGWRLAIPGWPERGQSCRVVHWCVCSAASCPGAYGDGGPHPPTVRTLPFNHRATQSLRKYLVRKRSADDPGRSTRVRVHCISAPYGSAAAEPKSGWSEAPVCTVSARGFSAGSGRCMLVSTPARTGARSSADECPHRLPDPAAHNDKGIQPPPTPALPSTGGSAGYTSNRRLRVQRINHTGGIRGSRRTYPLDFVSRR